MPEASGRHRGAGGVVLENELVVAGHRGGNGDDAYLGYILVETRRHVRGFGELTDAESAAVGVAVNRISRELKRLLGADHVYAFVQGDAVPHFHLHVVPRYPATPETYRNPLGASDWPDAPRGGAADIAAFCRQLHIGLRE